MYDLEGTDTDREWIEVYNDGSSVDLTTWKFFEANTNHTLVLSQGSGTLSTGSFAVIVQNPSAFLSDWPGYSGTIFDSSFSLSNESGETIGMKDGSLSLIDEVTYAGSVNGGAGDGNSIIGSGSSWSAGAPTPGSENLDGTTNTSDDSQTTTSITTVLTEDGELVPLQNNWSISLTTPSYISMGNSGVFNATVKNLFLQEVHTGHFIWNMGDGTVYQGDSYEEVTHTYIYPGEYVLHLDYYRFGSKEVEVSVRKTILVTDTEIEISSIVRNGNLIDTKITNNGSREVDVSYWSIRNGTSVYVLPYNTVVLPNKSIVIPSKNTGFVGNSGAVLSLSSFGSDVSPLFASSTKSFVPQKSGSYVTKTQSDFQVSEQADEVDFAQSKNFITGDDLTADVSKSGEDPKNFAFLGFVGLLALSTISVLYIRKSRKLSEPKGNNFSAEDFELLE